MKSFKYPLTAAILWIAAVFNFSSCIFDAPGDKFYRTLWESTENPLGPFETNELTLEFLCGNAISIKGDNHIGASYGTYACNDKTAVFQDLTMELDGHLVTFIDAQLSGETLFLRWRIENSVYPFTTAMHRPQSYK